MKHYVQATANQPQQSGGNNTTLSAKTSTGLKAEIGPELVAEGLVTAGTSLTLCVLITKYASSILWLIFF